jgi:hypothetical protein
MQRKAQQQRADEDRRRRVAARTRVDAAAEMERARLSTLQHMLEDVDVGDSGNGNGRG